MQACWNYPPAQMLRSRPSGADRPGGLSHVSRWLDGASRILRKGGAGPSGRRWRKRWARSLRRGPMPDSLIHDVKPLADAGAGELSFLDNRKYLPQLAGDAGSRLPGGPGVCRPRAARAPSSLLSGAPYRGFRPGAAALLSRCHDIQGRDGRQRRAADPSHAPGWRRTCWSSPAPSSAAKPRSGAAPPWPPAR